MTEDLIILLGAIITSVGATNIICIACDHYVDPFMGLGSIYPKLRKSWLYNHPRFVMSSGVLLFILGILLIMTGIQI